MDTLYCACCGRPFKRLSTRGPAPLYCSQDCRRQIDVRRRARLAAEARELQRTNDNAEARRLSA